MKRHVGVLVIIVCFLSSLTTGCWTGRQVEELGFVLALGIDQGDQPGTYKVTYQIAQPQKESGGGGGADNWTVTVESSGIRESLKTVYEVLNREPFVGTVKVVLIGEDVAKSGINKALDFIQRYYEFRRTTYLLLVEGTAQDVLNVKLRNQKIPALSLLGRIEQSGSISTFPTVRLGHYLTLLGTNITAPVIPQVRLLKSGEHGVEYADKEGKAEELCLEGVGVFRGDKLAGELSDQEAKGYMWLCNEVKQRLISNEDAQGNFYGGRVIKTSTKSKIEQVDGTMGIHYQVNAVVALNEFTGQEEKDLPDWIAIVDEGEKVFAGQITEECQAALAKSRELGLDFLGIGRIIEEQRPRYWQQIKGEWAEFLPDFPVRLDVQVEIEHTGSSFNGPVNPDGQGQE